MYIYIYIYIYTHVIISLLSSRTSVQSYRHIPRLSIDVRARKRRMCPDSCSTKRWSSKRYWRKTKVVLVKVVS